MADDAGALLVRSGLVTSTALEVARVRVTADGGTIGEALVAANAVGDEELTEFYRQRLLVPRVNPNSLSRLPARVVASIPADLAVELRAIPVDVDGDGTLTVAMSDPSDRHAVDEIASATGAYVLRAVATQMQIAWCLANYYGHITELGHKLLHEDTDRHAPAPPVSPRKKSITEQIKASRTKRLERGNVMASDLMAELETAQRQPGEPSVPAKVRAKSPVFPLDESQPIQRVRASSPVLPLDESVSIRVGSSGFPLDESGPINIRSGPVDLRSRPPVEESGPVDLRRMLALDESGPVVRSQAFPDESSPIRVRAQSPVFPLDESGPVNIRSHTPLDLDESGPVITIEAAEPSEPVITIEAAPPEESAGHNLPPLRRIKPADPDPPELAARAGEVQLAGGTRMNAINFEVLPSIMISDELEHALKPPPRAEPSAPVPVDPAGDISEVVVLDVRKPPKRSLDRNTQVGIGVVGAPLKARTSAVEPPVSDDDIATDVRAALDLDPTRVDTRAVPPSDDFTSTSEELLAAPPAPASYGDSRDTMRTIVGPPPPSSAVPPPSGAVSFEKVQRARVVEDDEDDDEAKEGKLTAVMSALELDEMIPDRMSDPVLATKRAPRRAATDSDEWGPPGTTIPPPLLGAIPGSLEPTSGMIPLPDIDSAPLMVAPPTPPESVPGTNIPALARALEDATARMLELIHTLDHALERDQVIALMIAHLAESHQRAGFLAARSGELTLFALAPRVPVMSSAKLRLDRGSTLQDVVGTRLPYRGPLLDDASRAFVHAILGVVPAELLLVPIAIRDRVVGVLFGEHRTKHTFDDQLALAARAAGMALERILKARRA